MKSATASSGSQRTDALEALLEIGRDLTASLGSLDRYERLLAAVRRVLPFDAACLLRLQGDELVPLAAHGLVPAALERPYPRHRHPRLDAILRAPGSDPLPSRQPRSPIPSTASSTADPHALERIHACLGCPLTSDGEVVGALTADALDPHAFDGLDARLLATLGALAGAALRTATLIEALERRAERGTRVARELQRSADESSGAAILGTSAAIASLLSEISVVAASDLPVLVTGETGVGKELVARQVHTLSRRHEEALIHVNCAALPESIAESELFGHVAGAFTGAARDRAGKFEVADGGSLFLDEIGELPLSLQPKLLRALQQGEIQRIGSDRLHRVDVRIIAATNRDLLAEVERGRFRADLYHRLAVYPDPGARRSASGGRTSRCSPRTSPTRPARRLGLGPLRLDEEVRERLAAADWPGNVRELENVVSRAVLRAAAGRPPGDDDRRRPRPRRRGDGSRARGGGRPRRAGPGRRTAAGPGGGVRAEAHPRSGGAARRQPGRRGARARDAPREPPPPRAEARAEGLTGAGAADLRGATAGGSSRLLGRGSTLLQGEGHMEHSFVSATILLVLITDPLGNIPFFISALKHVRPERKRIVVVRECLIAFAALLLFLVAGRPILRLLHLSEDALRVSGGVVLLLIAIRMIFPDHGARLGEDDGEAGEPFIVPVAIPLIAGPSAMATVLLMSTPDPAQMLSLAGSLTVTIAITAVVFVSSTRIQKVLGEQAITALERLMGLVLTAIAVEMLLGGVASYIRRVPG